VIYMDHKPLTYALHRTSDPWTARQCRQLAYVAEFSDNIRHLKGVSNVVADALSRPPSSDHPNNPVTVAVQPPPLLPFTPASLAEAQVACKEVTNLIQMPSLRVSKTVWDGAEVWCDVSSSVQRPSVPRRLRQEVFNSLHSLSHPGIRCSRRLISSQFVWKGLSADVKKWCDDCQQCQRGKVSTQPAVAVESKERKKERKYIYYYKLNKHTIITRGV